MKRSRKQFRNAFTLKEWAGHFECSMMRMRNLMVEAKAAGALQVTRLMRERLDGVITQVPGYRFDVEEGDD